MMNMNTSNSVLTQDRITMYNNDVTTDIMPSSYTNTNSTVDEEQMLLDIQRKLGATAVAVDNNVEYNSDIMPSQSTMSLSFKRQYEANINAVAKVAMTTKTKVAIASYIAVVLVLILGITLCSLAVTSSFATVGSLDTAYGNINDELAALEGAINGNLDYSQLLDRATKLGFVTSNGGNSYSYDILETRPAQNIVVNSNWFDKLCDWVGEMFGG